MTRLYRFISNPLWIGLLWVAGPALARVGSGEHYVGQSPNSNKLGDGGGDGELIGWLIFLAFRNPVIGIPLLIGVGAVVWYVKSQEGSRSTYRAIQRSDELTRTRVSVDDVNHWEQLLKAKDAAFDLGHLLSRADSLFLQVQNAWFERDLSKVRRYLSDAMYQRLTLQQRLLDLQGVRDAIADVSVQSVTLIGVEQTEQFDTAHLRVQASMRDADVSHSANMDEALAAAKRQPLESFIEVWSFVRRGRAQTQPDRELPTGNCPNCGAPYDGGASNICSYCKAVVNSGNYDWVLAEITQGAEFVRSNTAIEGFARAKQTDPELSTETLEDRASLIFWKWIEAQATGNRIALTKLSTPEFLSQLDSELADLSSRSRRRVFLECAVGAVTTRQLRNDGVNEFSHMEIRWSARMGIGPIASAPPKNLPVAPQRWVFVLQRKLGATTLSKHGVATDRCPNCSAPLSDNGQPSCEFCGTILQSGEKDWVLVQAQPWEFWAAPSASMQTAGAAPPVPDRVVSQDERERLLYMMAAMAAADGTVDARERSLLKECAKRWNVPFANVELALEASSSLFDRLLQKKTPAAERFIQELVALALVDGKVDRRERMLLEHAADHLGIERAQLSKMLNGSKRA